MQHPVFAALVGSEHDQPGEQSEQGEAVTGHRRQRKEQMEILPLPLREGAV
jgi:hypothetical protein